MGPRRARPLVSARPRARARTFFLSTRYGAPAKAPVCFMLPLLFLAGEEVFTSIGTAPSAIGPAPSTIATP